MSNEFLFLRLILPVLFNLKKQFNSSIFTAKQLEGNRIRKLTLKLGQTE